MPDYEALRIYDRIYIVLGYHKTRTSIDRSKLLLKCIGSINPNDPEKFPYTGLYPIPIKTNPKNIIYCKK